MKGKTIAIVGLTTAAVLSISNMFHDVNWRKNVNVEKPRYAVQPVSERMRPSVPSSSPPVEYAESRWMEVEDAGEWTRTVNRVDGHWLQAKPNETSAK